MATTPSRTAPLGGLAVAALLLTAPPLAAQEAAPSVTGPRGAPVGGSSLGAPLQPFGSIDTAPPSAPSGGGAGTPARGAAPTASGTTAPPVRFGAFGAPFTPAPAAGGEGSDDPGRAWRIVPGIAVDIGATDNVFQTPNDRRADAFVRITPSILIEGATDRVRALINYAPTAQLYATYTGQNNVAQLGNGLILAEIIPDALFLDVRGAASLGSSSGGVLPGTALDTTRNNQVQTYNLQVSPYYLHRFGTLATAQLGYAFTYSLQSGDDQFLPGATLPSFTGQDYTSNRGYLVVRSGEDFGRLALQGRVDGTAFEGTGIYDGAHVFVAALEARYSITSTIAVLLEGGYENIEYAGTNPGRINDAIWSVGVRLTPTPDSFLTARYGHRGGFDSPSLEAGIQLGGFTRLTASYEERLSTSALSAQSLLDTTTLDELGNPVDARSGAPVLYSNAFFPAQSGLFRMQTGAVAITQSWPRDSLTLTAYYQRQQPVSAAQGTQIFETTGYYGGISWTHELTPDTAFNVGVQAGRSEQQGQPSSRVINATAAIQHQLTERLSAVLRYIYINSSSSTATSDFDQSIVLAGLRYSF